MAQKLLSQLRFHGGISSSEKEGPKYAYAFGRSVDYRTDPRKIKILPRASKESGSTVVDLPMWAETIGTDDYWYGNAGHLYKRTSAGAYSDLRTVASSSGNGLVYFPEDDYLYYMRDKTFGRYGPITGTPAFVDDYPNQADDPTNTYSLNLVAASSQYASRADTASLSITGNITIELWWYMASSFSAGETRYLVDKGGSYSLRIVESAGTLLMKFNVNDGTGEDLQVDFGLLATGFWHHVAVSWVASTSTASFYRGGILIAAPVGTKTSIANTANAFSVGSIYTGGSYWNGRLDEVRIWNTARTGTQIIDNMQIEISGSSSGLAAYYKFNNNLNDSTANGNNLTGSGTPTYSTNVPFAGEAVGADRSDIDQYLDTSGNTYTLETAINEGATHRQTFIPRKDPQKSIEVLVAAIGTGDWTLTVHDSQNNTLASKTVANASMATGDFEFEFSSVWRPVIGKSYHFHLTSTVADGTVTTTTASDLETVDFHTYYQYLVDDDFHPGARFLNFVVIGNERYIAKWDGITYEPHKLVLPSGTRIRCFAQVGEYLAIGTWKGSAITDYEQGKIFFWDGTSSSFNDQLDIPEGGVNAILSKQGRLYYWAGSVGDMFEYTGLSTKLKRLPKMTEDTYVEMFPGAVTVYRSLIRFGVAGNSDNTSIEKGVYTWGSLDVNYPDSLSYDYPISTGTRTGNTLQIGCVHAKGTDLFIGWRDNSTYGIDKVNPDNDPYTTATIELLIFDDDSTYKVKSAEGIKVTSLAINSGESFTMKYKKDRSSSWSSGVDTKTISTTGATQGSLAIDTDDKRFREFQVAVDLATSTTTSPTITSISLLFDDMNEETQILEENA